MLRLKITGDEVISDAYGKGVVEQQDGRKILTFKVALSDGSVASLKYTYIEKNSRYTVALNAPGGYVQSGAAGGRCRMS